MGFSEDQIIAWAMGYAYQPFLVYGAVVLLMIASSFGLPVPEEVTLVSTGLLCYIGSRPDLYPPPYPGAPVVELQVAAVVAFCAVFLSDFLVFNLGRFFGDRFQRTKFFASHQDKFNKVRLWVEKYGMWAAGIFRFTPGLRFPGHLSCGMLGLRPKHFILVDGAAALISVPTQIYFISKYGETILAKIQQAKLLVFAVIAVLVVIAVVRAILKRRQREAV